jgi:hypothetical protein
MKYFLTIVFSLTSLILSNFANASNCDSSCQIDQIKSYFSALDKISRENSTVNDIDYLLSLMHDDVKYVHVEYEANFNKESWRKAFNRNLNRGAYKNTDKNEMRVLNSISGKNYLAIEYSHGVIQEDGTWQQTEPLLVLFGFTEGKISLVKELW